jgi:uncharacterized protein (DUF111 family)
MPIQEKGYLYLLKCDHLSGEEVGHLVDMLYVQGAHDVQVVSSLTKKDRPGCLVLVDCGMLDDTVFNLARQFGISGCHRVETVHLVEPVSSKTQPFTFRCKGRSLQVDLPIKVVDDPAAPLSMRLEYDSLVDILDRIGQAFGVEPGIAWLSTLIESRLIVGGPYQVDLDQEV